MGDNQIKLKRRNAVSTYANITIESLSRDDVQTELTCQATNFQATVLRTSVEIDMKCKWANYIFIYIYIHIYIYI